MTRLPGFKWLVLPAVTLVMMLGLSASRVSATTPGWVDLSYGVSGVADLPPATLRGTTVVDAMGRAVVLGPGNASGNADRVTRLTASGGVDMSFGTAGVFVLPSAKFFTQIVIGPSGSIYLLGGEAAIDSPSSQIIVMKLTSTGSPDNTFGSSGMSVLAVGTIGSPAYVFEDMTVRNDGDVIISLQTKDPIHTGFLAALTPTGTLDATFGTVSTPGWRTFPADQFPYGVKAAIAGNSIGLLLANVQNPTPVFGFQTYSSTGTLGLSTSFSAALSPFALAPSPDGSYLVSGTTGSAVFLGRIATNGALVTLQGPSETCAPGGGQIVIAGSDIYVIALLSDTSTTCQPSPALVLRFTAGQLDPGFGSAGEVRIDFVSSLTVFGPNGGGVQPDGHLLVGVDGSTDPKFATQNAAVLRLNTAPAPPAVQAFVQGANDTFFSAEKVADNPAIFAGTPSPVVDAGKTTDVFLLGTNQHLYVSQRTSGWTAPADITAAVTGAPNLQSSPVAVLNGSILHVFALSAANSDLIDYHNDGPGGGWLTTDVTSTDPGAPAINQALSAVRLGGTLHVYGTTAAGALVEIDNDNQAGHQWNFYDESGSAGGGVATAGAPGALLINGIPHVYTRASGSNDLVEFVADHVGGRIWNAYDQTQSAPGSPTLSGNPIPTLIGTTPHVYVDDGQTGDLVEFVADHLSGRIWNSYDQTTGSGAPKLSGNPSVVLVDGTPYGQAGTQVPEVFENASGALAIVAADHQFGSIWNAYDVTYLSGGSPMTGDPSAVINGPFVEVLGLTGPLAAAAASSKVGAQVAAPPVKTARPAVTIAPGSPKVGPFVHVSELRPTLAR